MSIKEAVIGRVDMNKLSGVLGQVKGLCATLVSFLDDESRQLFWELLHIWVKEQYSITAPKDLPQKRLFDDKPKASQVPADPPVNPPAAGGRVPFDRAWGIEEDRREAARCREAALLIVKIEKVSSVCGWSAESLKEAMIRNRSIAEKAKSLGQCSENAIRTMRKTFITMSNMAAGE